MLRLLALTRAADVLVRLKLLFICDFELTFLLIRFNFFVREADTLVAELSGFARVTCSFKSFSFWLNYIRPVCMADISAEIFTVGAEGNSLRIYSISGLSGPDAVHVPGRLEYSSRSSLSLLFVLLLALKFGCFLSYFYLFGFI